MKKGMGTARTTLSRRQFAALMGMGIATVSAASLTGCAPASVASTKIAKTYNYDVIVIGSGGAGTTAAAFACKNGAKTACLEKLSFQGGSSSLALGTFYGSGTVQQKELGIQDTPDDLYNYFLKRGAEKVSLDMNRFMADHAGETIDWLREDLQVPFKDTIKGNGTDKVQRGHMCKNNADDALKAVRTFADEQGVEFHFDTDASALIVDDSGAVTGVKAKTAEGTVVYNAKKVIIASGGFCRNPDMIAKYCPDYVGVYTEVGVGLVGSGLQMGLDIGANYVGNGGTNGILSCAVDAGQSTLIANTAMWVNTQGERFTNEAGQTHDIFYTVAKYPDQKFYAVYDQAMVDALTDEMKKKFQFGLDQGIFAQGATASEAAAKLGVDPSATQSALDAYNAMADAGVDTLFKKKAELMKPITKAPFYLLSMGVCTHGSFGGLETDTDFQVKDTAGNIIPNLYSAGEVCCGTFIYQDYPAGGCGLNFSYTSGRFAGANAAAAALKA
jgi:flavocytochrome c